MVCAAAVAPLRSDPIWFQGWYPRLCPRRFYFIFFPNQQHMGTFVSRKIIPGEEKVARGQLRSVVLCFLF